MESRCRSEGVSGASFVVELLGVCDVATAGCAFEKESRLPGCELQRVPTDCVGPEDADAGKDPATSFGRVAVGVHGFSSSRAAGCAVGHGSGEPPDALFLPRRSGPKLTMCGVADQEINSYY